MVLRKDSRAGEALAEAKAQAKMLQQQLTTLQQKSTRRVSELEGRLAKVEGGGMEGEIRRREERAFSLGAVASAAKLQQLVDEKEELESEVQRLQQAVTEAEAHRDAAKAEQAAERQKWRSYQQRTERASQEASQELHVLQTQKEQVPPCVTVYDRMCPYVTELHVPQTVWNRAAHVLQVYVVGWRPVPFREFVSVHMVKPLHSHPSVLTPRQPWGSFSTVGHLLHRAIRPP